MVQNCWDYRLVLPCHALFIYLLCGPQISRLVKKKPPTQNFILRLCLPPCIKPEPALDKDSLDLGTNWHWRSSDLGDLCKLVQFPELPSPGLWKEETVILPLGAVVMTPLD